MVRALGKVVTVKLALVAPAGTVTLAGTLAARGRLLPRLTATPPTGAALASLTVPVAVAPPATLVGFTVSAVSAGKAGYSVRGADRVTPPPDTEIVTSDCAVTGVVTILKNPTPLPAKTVTTLGTEASNGLLLVTCSSWSKPKPSAAVTTPWEPLVVAIGLTKNEVGAAAGIRLICHWADTPLRLAVIVTVVAVVTGLVWI